MSLAKSIFKYSRIAPTPLKLKTMYAYAKSSRKEDIINQAKFMRQEIPIRLAHRVIELENLPHKLANISQIQYVADLYRNSFDMIYQTPTPKNIYDCSKLSNILSDIKDRHQAVQLDIGKGIQDWVQQNSNINYDINYFLDKFYMSRIGIRTLIGQYIGVERYQQGIIQTCKPKDIIENAINRAQEACDLEYADYPEVTIHSNQYPFESDILNNQKSSIHSNSKITEENDTSFKYIPSHLYYITYELLKNSMKAVMEKNNNDLNGISDDLYPKDIKVYISKGSKDLIIRITDFGGGFPRDDIDKMFKYSYTTTKKNINPSQLFETPSILSGLGYGLPLSRLYCRYFKGELQIIPYEGIGTDALIFINRLGDTDEAI